MAAGAEAGFFAPAEDDLDLTPIVGGFFEYYFTPRLSIRPGIAFLDTGFDIGDPDDSVRQVRFGADLIYNWERGEWHPFAGGGLSIHSLRLKDNGHAFGDSEQQLGVSGLGGVEYLLPPAHVAQVRGTRAVRRRRVRLRRRRCLGNRGREVVLLIDGFSPSAGPPRPGGRAPAIRRHEALQPGARRRLVPVKSFMLQPPRGLSMADCRFA